MKLNKSIKNIFKKFIKIIIMINNLTNRYKIKVNNKVQKYSKRNINS